MKHLGALSRSSINGSFYCYTVVIIITVSILVTSAVFRTVRGEGSSSFPERMA